MPCYGLLAMLVLISWIPNQINSQDHMHGTAGPVSFDSIEEVVLKLEDDGRYEEARDLLLKHESDFPDHWFRWSKEMIYLNKKTDRYTDNLELFEKGHERGYFYFLNTRFASCEPYLGMQSFEKLAGHDQELRQSAIHNSQSEYEVVTPIDYDPARGYPAIIVLHGGGSNIERAKKHWRSVALDRKFLLIFIRSYLHYDYNTFGWKKYDPRARADIARCLSEAEKGYKIIPEEISIAGISAGATMALDMFINKLIPLKACIAFSPARPSEFLNDETPAEGFEGKTAVMLIGEKDSQGRKETFLEMAETMNKNGIHTAVTLIPDTGHEYPLDFSYWIHTTLAIVYPELIPE